LEGPALAPPPGIVPNFTGPPNQDALGYALLITGLSLSVIAVVIRLYAKIFCVKVRDRRLYVDSGVYAGCQYFIIRVLQFPGIYVYQWNIRLKDLSGILYVSSTGSGSSHEALTSLGISVLAPLCTQGILLEWIHLSAPRGLRNTSFWTYHVTIWINVMFYIACTIVEIFGCHPREKFWNKLILGGSCVNLQAVILASSVLNFVSDLIVLALPQKTIWSLQMSLRKKVDVSAIFAIGIFGCVCGTVRMIHSIKLLSSDDVTYTLSPVGLWCVVEITSEFLIFCIPSIPKAV
ncbi:hypothetical protein AOQ84DRAFT_266597, partial [Glonium stellatum]